MMQCNYDEKCNEISNSLRGNFSSNELITEQVRAVLCDLERQQSHPGINTLLPAIKQCMYAIDTYKYILYTHSVHRWSSHIMYQPEQVLQRAEAPLLTPTLPWEAGTGSRWGGEKTKGVAFV